MEEIKPPVITYKGLEFSIKPNRLNVSRYLIPLAAKLRKAEREATKLTIITPEYIRYSAIQDTISVMEADLKRNEDLTPANEAEQKSKDDTIAKNKEHIKAEEDKLKEPALQDMAQQYMDEVLAQRIQFFIDTDNIKILCQALLEGEINSIDFDNLDDDFWTLVDTLRDFFLIIETKTRLNRFTR